ncbi:MAG TPA: DUF4394 domain-containing protein [Pyrinomonadaceae bacterium]|nr:DUF4394 domain-containing protein [Pyrinomonadaceae bacterium]
MNSLHPNRLVPAQLAIVICTLVCLAFIGSRAVEAAPLVALTETNRLQRIETTAPQLVQSSITVTGLQLGEKLLAIDFRPATGQLYGITDASRIYIINLTTGNALRVSNADSFSPPLNLGVIRGWSVDLGFDFDPVNDRIRVVTATGQNLRLNPDTGTVVSVDTPLAFASGDVNAGRVPAVSAAAYTNSISGATLYAIFNSNGSGPESTVLATQGSLGGNPVSPDTGQLFTVGNIGIVFIEPTGLDIGADGAFALLSSTDSRNQLFAINLATGSPSHIGGIGSEPLRDIAAVPLNSTPPAGTFQFDPASFNVNENANSVTVTVTRTGDTTVASAVELTTVDDSAKQRSDYIIARRKLQFGAGETSQSVKILVVDDVFVEPSETFNMFLSDATAGFLPGTPNSASVTIIDNDAVQPTSNPLDDPQFFVRQHYFDFLNREPGLGLNFWVNEITSCGSDQQCIEIKRINVSAAFFLSIEFQRTGMVAYLTEKRAFPGLPRYAAFMRDVQALQKDFSFGAPGADAQLEANTKAFFDEFVTRSDFLSKFGGLSNAQYVAALGGNTAGGLFITALTGSQVVPPTNTSASGVGVARFRSVSQPVEFSLSFKNLSSPQTAAHIHGPAPAGSNGPVVITLPSGEFRNLGITLTTGVGDALRSGQLYFDIHTRDHPEGEIRGQIPIIRFNNDVLVEALDQGIITRAEALRLLVEDPGFREAELNRAFVLMEYFGYLRRNPNDPPDNSLAGFNFWLNKLNFFNGNFVQAEMVKAFISSIEYRSRFGPP